MTAFWFATALGLSARMTMPSDACVEQEGNSLPPMKGSTLLSLRGLGAHASTRQMRHWAGTLSPSW